MTRLNRFKFFLWKFSRFKVPLIGYLKPSLLALDDEQLIIRIALNRRSKNHLNSMYFGALSVGADLAGGLHAFYHADKKKVNISLAFKSFQAQFLRRPESDVYFICKMGRDVEAAIQESIDSKERINKMLKIDALVNYPNQPEVVAQFTLELSTKVVS